MSQQSANEERRRLPRRRTLKAGRVVLDPRAPALECIVRNLSAEGALLLIPSLAVPDRFDLLMSSEPSRHPCRVVWRALDRVGVEFELMPSGDTADGVGQTRSSAVPRSYGGS